MSTPGTPGSNGPFISDDTRALATYIAGAGARAAPEEVLELKNQIRYLQENLPQKSA